jgi:nitronate monooxygenase
MESKDPRSEGELNVRAKAFMKTFGLDYPIIQAAPGGERLANAIANAGAMGALQLGWATPEDGYNIVSRMLASTRGNFYANYVLHAEPVSLDRVLEAGCPTVQFSWGLPSLEIVSKIRNAQARFGIQISSRQNAQRALELHPDFLICQGIEAGGHVQGTSSLSDTLHEVLEVASVVPVLASGGIATGYDIKRVINSGAAGAVLGTRFMATVESDGNDVYKRALVEAGVNSTVYTNCFNRDWQALHRVLRNSTFLAWEAEGEPLTGSKPGENDIVAIEADGSEVLRYSTSGYSAQEGQLEAVAMYAGQGVDQVNDLPHASDLVARLWWEFNDQ